MNIYVASLGCPKNRTDTEEILARLRAILTDYKITQEPGDADILLVNTCAFIQEAVEESIETILELAQSKKPHQKIVVMGCLYERYKDALIKELPEVDVFFGHRLTPRTIKGLLDRAVPKGAISLNDVLSSPYIPYGRLLTTPPWRAYLKIIEGCSHRCTYCLIPGIRGEKRPRPLGVIMEELKALEERGIKEVTLVGQDLTSWSWEGKGTRDLLELMARESAIPWIRPLYFHPIGVDRTLLETVIGSPQICNYLDIPIQHASTRILKRMGRTYDTDYLKRLFSMIRDDFPEIFLRTTVMVGFPGEQEQDFKGLIDLIEEVQFDHLGCFCYSDEEEAPSYKFRGKVPEKVAQERRKIVLATQRAISKKRLSSLKGKRIPVLVEGLSQETDLLLEGRTEFQAPEVDGVVFINEGHAHEGEFSLVEIVDTLEYDLVGKVIRPLAGQDVQSAQSFCHKSPLPPH